MSFQIAIRSVLFFLLGLCFTGTASAQRAGIDPDTGDAGTGGRYMIQGTLLFPSGVRVDRPMRVRLYTLTRGDMTTVTDTHGNFIFRRLRPGSYTIVIDNEKDYEPVNQNLNIVQAGRSMGSVEEIIPVQIRLKPNVTRGLKPAVVHAELANVPRPALDLYNKALELAQAGKNKAAIENLNRAVSEHPAFMLAFTELGVQYLRMGELEKANDSLQSALKIAPDAFVPLVNRGIALVRLKRFAEAEVDLRNAVKGKPESSVAHYYLGRALAYQGRFDEAEKELTAAVTSGGDEMKEAHRYLGAIYHARGDSNRAIQELETYLRIAPKAEDAEQVRELIRQLKKAKK